MYCVAVEMTNQVLAERYRSEENERLRALFEQAPGFMVLIGIAAESLPTAFESSPRAGVARAMRRGAGHWLVPGKHRHSGVDRR